MKNKMKNKLSILIFGIFISLIICNSLVVAFIVPDTHDAIGMDALKIANNPIIANNWEDFSACQSLDDYSVFYYLSVSGGIGKQYLASHNFEICQRCFEISNKYDPAEQACCYGVCAMSFSDSASHNFLVPDNLKRVWLGLGLNGIFHAPIEECVNQQITTTTLHKAGIQAILNKYSVHKAFLIKVFQSDSRTSNIDVGTMLEAFEIEVTGNTGYTVGFRGFTAIPTEIHIILLLIFLASLFGLALLIRMKNRNIFNKISMGFCLFLIIFIIALYVLYFTGHIWQVFQVATHPFCGWAIPINNWQYYYNQAVSNDVLLFTNGASAINQLPDPAGVNALAAADKAGANSRLIFIVVIVLIVALFVWLNFRKRKK